MFTPLCSLGEPACAWSSCCFIEIVYTFHVQRISHVSSLLLLICHVPLHPRHGYSIGRDHRFFQAIIRATAQRAVRGHILRASLWSEVQKTYVFMPIHNASIEIVRIQIRKTLCEGTMCWFNRLIDGRILCDGQSPL